MHSPEPPVDLDLQKQSWFFVKGARLWMHVADFSLPFEDGGRVDSRSRSLLQAFSKASTNKILAKALATGRW
jgi:hypothetical protein